MFLLRYLAFQKFGAVIFEHAVLIASLFMLQVQIAALTPESFVLGLSKAFVVTMTFQASLHLMDGYDFGVKPWKREFLLDFGQAVLIACIALSTAQLILPELVVQREYLLITLVGISVGLAAWHFLVRVYFGVDRRRSPVLIMGTGPLARALAVELLNHRELGLTVCGFVDDDPKLVGVSIVNPKVLGLNRDLRQIVSEHKIERIVVELGDRRGRLPVDDLLGLKMGGVQVEDAISLYERVTGKIATENLKPSWMIFGEGFQVSRRKLLQMRIVSLAVSLVSLLVLLPLFPLIALLIKLDSRGPVFHRQERVGQNGNVFRLWKFRSMRADAERETGPVWSRADDNRVTRIGKYLRRTRLDEVPQFVNVLKGDMSFVGPRPERPHFVAELSQTIPFYHLRHAVKPGITGWAQINYRYGNSVEDSVQKLQYDLFYMKHHSWVLDLLILLHTVKTVLVRKGS